MIFIGKRQVVAPLILQINKTNVRLSFFCRFLTVFKYNCVWECEEGVSPSMKKARTALVLNSIELCNVCAWIAIWT